MFSTDRFSQVRYFNKKKYLTDYKKYDKLEAHVVVLYLKAKHAGILPIRARVIDRGNYCHIYFDENTYNQMQHGIVKLPKYSDVPDSVVRKVQSTEIKENMGKSGHKIQEIRSNYMYGRKESFQVVRSVVEKPKHELIKETRKIEKINAIDTLEDSLRFMLLIEILHNMFLIPDDVYDLKYWANKEAFDHVHDIWEKERDLNESLDIIKDRFLDACPKCGSEMKPNFIILRGKGRLSVYQCILCKFYLPRSIN